MPYADPAVRRAKQRLYNESHKEELARQRKENYARNVETLRAAKRAYRLAHPEKTRASQRKSYRKHHTVNLARAAARNAANREENNAKKRLFYALHQKDMCTRSKKSRKKNLSLRLELNRQRRAIQRQAPLSDLSNAQWQEIQAAFHDRCAYCGKRCKGRLTQDHVTPYTQHGSHTLWNVVPACRSCNARKKDRAVLCPVQPLLLTLAKEKMNGKNK